MTTAVDNQLDLARLRRQDPDEFARFVHGHERLVLGLCQTLGLSGADADDAAAETFAQAYTALPRFRADSQLSTWLYRIAYRTAVRIRRQCPAPRPDLVDRKDPQASGPSKAAEAKETAAAVWEAVHRLEPEQAAVMELFYRRGMPVEEVAQVLEAVSKLHILKFAP